MRAFVRLAVRRPWFVIVGWLAVLVLANLGGRMVHPPAPSSSFLPAAAESQRAAVLEATRFGGGHQVAEVVIVDQNGLRSSDHVLAGRLNDWLNTRPRSERIQSVSPAYPSPDGKALVMQVTFAVASTVDEQPDASIAAIEEHLANLVVPPGVRVGITGDPVISHDIGAGISGSSSSGRSNLLRVISILIIVVVLALVYRAPLPVLVPLLSIGVVLAISSNLLNIAAALVGLPLGSFSLPFVFAVTLGAGTNYGIFLISRYREELRRGSGRRHALEVAAPGVAPAIASSAATVVLGTAAMAFTSLGFFRTLGPAVAISIVVMLAAGLSLTPALIAISRGAFFWPRWPRSAGPSADPASSTWHRVGALVTRRPAVALVVVLAVLALPAWALTRVQVSVDSLSSLPGGSPSLAGYHLLQAHFPVQTQAASVFVTTGGTQLEGAQLGRVRDAMHATPGITSVSDPEVSPDGSAARFRLVLSNESSTEEASTAVTGAESAARRALAATTVENPSVLAGGEVAVDRDLRELLVQDFLRVLILVGAAIYLVLAILLRNLYAPIYLLASVGLSTAAAIGGVGLLYRVLADQPLYWAVPVFAFVFLVALGEDFNIYLVSRLRQQLSESDRAAGIARAVGLTGGPISSAGLVMAAAFFLFLGNPVPLVQQLGAVVVAGLLLDTFLVRPLLVPAIVRLLGGRSGISVARARSSPISAESPARQLQQPRPGAGETVAAGQYVQPLSGRDELGGKK
ncbi:MAG TPA: MMPL family transporter [Candidatus Dormibacteraeota bacterium]|nr:MMPL family transporter [Candidatus Dormibacteraeota bacterium]